MSLNLSQMAASVCLIIDEPDAASIAACKTFLKQRAQMIWDSELWRESLVLVTTTMDPDDTSDPVKASGVWVLPNIADLVVALRTSDRRLTVKNVEWFFQFDLDQFSNTGATADFMMLPKAAFTMDPNTTLALYANNAADNGAIVSVRGIYNGSVSQRNGTLYSTDWTINNGGVSPTNFVSGLSEITSITKPAGQGNFFAGTSVSITGVPEVQMVNTDTNAFQYARVKLMEPPTSTDQDLNLRALVKRFMPSFTLDQDTFLLTGFEEMLMLFAQHDMLKRKRQFAKASLVRQEANEILMNLRKREVYQQANNPRLVPDVEPLSTAFWGAPTKGNIFGF
jgi:hypothetical protein